MGGLDSLFGGGLTNSGTMPISGGHATSGNGDTAFDVNSNFGGLNFSTGISPTTLVLVAVATAAVVLLLKR